MPSLVSLDTILMAWAVAFTLMWRRPDGAWPRRLMLAALAGGLLVTTPIVPYAASSVLGSRYGQVQGDDPAAPLRVVVVLGAGTQVVEGGGRRVALLDGVGAGRVLEAARVYAVLDEPVVISSGGARRHSRELASAAVMRDTLVALGVDASRILLEDRSLTTRDEAVLVAPMLARLNTRRFVLVTSRDHMTRSLRAFRNEGLDPVPSVADDELVRAKWIDLLTPDVAGLRRSHALVHEVLGLAYYRWRGWLA